MLTSLSGHMSVRSIHGSARRLLHLPGSGFKPRSHHLYTFTALAVSVSLSALGRRYLHWNNNMSSPLDPSLKPPRELLKWNHSVAEIDELTTTSIKGSRDTLDAIAALPPSECTFDSVFLRIARDDSVIENIVGPLTFYQYVSTAEDIRNAANAAEIRVNEYAIESGMRVDVFKALKAAKENIDKSGKKLTAEEARLVEKLLLNGKRNGLDLPEETRTKVTEVRQFL